MIKKFAMLATVAALFVACSSAENTDAMETQAATDAKAEEMLDAAAAEEEVVVAPATTETEEVPVEEAAAEGTEAPATEAETAPEAQ